LEINYEYAIVLWRGTRCLGFSHGERTPCWLVWRWNQVRDNINYVIIKALTLLSRCVSLHIYILSSCIRVFSQKNGRNVVKTFTIPKQTEFRPISLAPCSCKVMEQIINNRLNWLKFENKLNFQYGFHRNRW